MSDKSKRIEKLREALGLNKNKFSVKLDIPNSYITRYEKYGEEPAPDFYVKVQRAFENVNIGWLISGVGDMFLNAPTTSKTGHVPLYGSVYCGTPASQWLESDVKKYFDIKLPYKDVFGFIARGDSMSPYINPYDTIFCVDKPELIKNRTAVVVVFKSTDTLEANAKLIKLRTDEKKITLYSVNTKYEPEDYHESEILKIYKVIGIYKEVK